MYATESQTKGEHNHQQLKDNDIFIDFLAKA